MSQWQDDKTQFTRFPHHSLDAYRVALEAPATGPGFDLALEAHHALIQGARAAKGGFPLVRRFSDYYRDTSFELDELDPLIAELRQLRDVEPGSVDAILGLAQAALSAELGLLAISD